MMLLSPLYLMGLESLLLKISLLTTKMTTAPLK